MVQRLQHLCGYDSMNCYTVDPDDLDDDSGRTEKREVILRDRFKQAAIALNPGFPESAIEDAIKQLCDKRQALAPIATACASSSVMSRAAPFRSQSPAYREMWDSEVEAAGNT